MKKLTLLFILSCFVLSAAAQKQDYIWHLGVDYSAEPGIQAMQIDFNLDQCLVSNLDGLQSNGMQYGRGNADNALAYADNPFLVERASDHDGFVLFLEAENAVNTAFTPAGEGLALRFSQPIRPGGVIHVKSRGSGPLRSLEMYSLQGRMVWREELSRTEASLRLPGFIPGGQMYLLRAAGERAVRVEKLVVE